MNKKIIHLLEGFTDILSEIAVVLAVIGVNVGIVYLIILCIKGILGAL